jgi:hypothetical protein
MSTFEILVRAALVGIGGTVVLDLYVALLQRVWGIPGSNWAMVGRWIGHMPRGQFVQRKLGDAEKIPGERALGWFFHYLIGIGYGLLLVALAGPGWLQEPSLAAPVLVALVLLVLPYFVMMPGMGMGIAAARAPRPVVARLKSVASHSVFGIGMYLTGLLLAKVLP